MVVQDIALLDDLDKEINIYSMLVKVCIYLNLGLACRYAVRNGTVGIFRNRMVAIKVRAIAYRAFRYTVTPRRR